MAKIRQIDPPYIPIKEVGDDPSGKRQVIRPWAQTFRGTKTFEALEITSDPDRGDDSLVNGADLAVMIGETGIQLPVTQAITLTAEDVASRGVALTGTPEAGTDVTLTLGGSGLYGEEDGVVADGAQVSWAGCPSSARCWRRGTRCLSGGRRAEWCRR